MTNFHAVAAMNEAFGNAKGDPTHIDWAKIRRQAVSMGHELVELLKALGATDGHANLLLDVLDSSDLFGTAAPVLDGVRDALCDVHVFGYGAHHLMGINADADMNSVLHGVMSRFIKDEADKAATIKKHAAKGVTKVYFEGEYPSVVMKSAEDQPDAPKGKFLKSASFKEPVFYPVEALSEVQPVYDNPAAVAARISSNVHGATVTELGSNPLNR